MSYDPISDVFRKDFEKVNRSNWQLGYKNRFSMDFGYLYPAGLWDVTPNTYFKLDLKAALSSNPTIAPLLGTLKFRAEAYYVEKAAYSNKLRNNEKLPVDRNVEWPIFRPSGGINVNSTASNQDYNVHFSPSTSLLDFLQMYPAGWRNDDWYLRLNDATNPPAGAIFPGLNAIPFLMYYDIYRNYYLNVQDSENVPIRSKGFTDDSAIEDRYVSRADFDAFIDESRNNPIFGVDAIYRSTFGFSPFGQLDHLSQMELQAKALPHKSFLHLGLLRRTYGNDFFTSFISNENVALMKSYSTVNVNNNQFNMEQISLANRNWRFATRSLLWGTDWKDYNRVHFGTKLKSCYGKPQFLGAISSDVYFNDVISQNQNGENTENSLNSNANLGSRAGLAFGTLVSNQGKRDRPFVEFTAPEEGYVMVLISLVPEVNYWQGVDPMYFKTNLNQSYSPEYNAYGMQDFHKAWSSVLPSYSGGAEYVRRFDMYNEAVAKVPIWYEYMAKYNQLHGLFTLDEQYKYWTFSRAFSQLTKYFTNIFEGDDQASVDFWRFYNSTYVLPEMFNYIFANNIGTDNFQCQVSFDCFQKNLLDKQIIAYL